MSSLHTYLNGRLATADELGPLSFSGFAHFTAMQVRAGKVRGLDLHLGRLRTANEILFGATTSDERMIRLLAAALDGEPNDVSLSCYVTDRPGEFAPAAAEADLDVLVKVSDPVSAPVGPLSLDVVKHERYLPSIKHVGEIAKTHLLRGAKDRGFDDVAFVDRGGRLSEATIWNLAFYDGSRVLWPKAEVLTGVTMGVVRRRLVEIGIQQATLEIRPEDLGGDVAAVVMNSWSPGVPVSRIGDSALAPADELVRILRTAYESEPASEL